MNKTVPTVLAGAAALGAAGSFVAAEYFLRAAAFRDPPQAFIRTMKKQVDVGDSVPALAEARERLCTAPHEVVTIRSQDGLHLKGHWFAHPEAERIILAVHGWRSLWYRDFGVAGEFWRENRCSVLYIEQRAQGESEGRYMTFGLRERYDCVAWLRWIQKRAGGGLPVYLAGISMGATTVLMAADLDLPGNVRGIMADCGYTSTDAEWKHVAENMLHVPYLPMRPWAAALFKQRTGLSSLTFSAADALRRTSLPVLLIHGEADNLVPVSMTHENYEAAAGEKFLLTVPGAGHGMSFLVKPKEYKDMELAFWARFDCPQA